MDKATESSSENAESQENDSLTTLKKNQSENCEVIMECQGLKVECNSPVNDSEKFASSIFTVEDNLDLTVFVGKLNSSVTCEMLHHFFQEGGLQTNDINKVGNIWKFLKNSEEFGITFVEFASNVAFETALTLNSRELSGNDLIIVPALSSHRGLIHLFAPSGLKMNDAESSQCFDKALDHDKNININECTASGIEDNLPINKSDFEHNEAKKDIMEEIIDCSNNIDSSKIASPDVSDLTVEHICTRQNENKVIEIDDSSVEEIYVAHDIVEENVNEDCEGDQTLGMDASTTEVQPTNVLESNVSKNSGTDSNVGRNSDTVSKFTAIIKDLPPDTKEEELMEFFNITPKDIQSIHFLRNARSRRACKRSARVIICFTTEECLNKCLAQTRSLFHYRQIFVEKHAEISKPNTGEKRPNSFQKSDRDITINASLKNKCENGNVVLDVNRKMEMDVFVKHVHKNVSDRHLIDFFASAGAIVKKLYRFPDLNKVRGMAFATMANTESVLRGLAMNGKMIYGAKIKVSVRNDRTYLTQPVKEETVKMFSVFIGWLPIKESADSLKISLKEYFEKLGCLIQFINVPSAVNHSGNRGYAYVAFDNEESLLKCQKLHRSEIVLNNYKIFIDVSKQWPEFRVATPSPIKNREAFFPTKGIPFQERPNKRRKKGTTHLLNTWDNKLRNSFKPGISKQFSQGTADYPPDHLSVMSDNSFQSDYRNYLDLLNVSDYERKAYDNQSFTSYESRGNSQCKQDYNSQANMGQQTFAALSANSSGPSSLGNLSAQLSVVQKTQLDNEMRDSSQYRARDFMDRVKYENMEHTHLPPSSYKWRDSPDYVGSHCSATDTDVATSSKARLNNISLYKRCDKQKYEHASPLYDSRNQYFMDKEPSSSYSSSLNNQISTRNSWVGSSNSDYPTSGGKFDSFVSSLPSTSGLAPSSVQPTRLSNDMSLFTRMDRRSFPYNTSDSSLYSETNDGMQTYPMSDTPTTSRPLYEITRYGHHVLSAEEKHKSSAYENSSSFVSKLAQSGILSNAGYDSYPGVGGYRAN